MRKSESLTKTMERDMIAFALARKTSMREAAALLGVPKSTFAEKVKKYRLNGDKKPDRPSKKRVAFATALALFADLDDADRRAVLRAVAVYYEITMPKDVGR